MKFFIFACSMAFIGHPILTLSKAEASANTKKLYVLCLKQEKLTNVTKNPTAFCDCWGSNLATLSPANQSLVIRAYEQPKFRKVFADEHNVLANFELDVVEKCLNDFNWRLP